MDPAYINTILLTLFVGVFKVMFSNLSRRSDECEKDRELLWEKMAEIKGERIEPVRCWSEHCPVPSKPGKLLSSIMVVAGILMSGSSVSCTSIYGNRNTGVFAVQSLGGDLKGLAMTPEGVTADQISNSPAFQDLAKTIRTGIYMGAAKAIAGSLTSAWKSTTNAKTAAGTAKVQAQEQTKQASINANAATEQAQIQATTEQAALGQ